MSSGINRAGSKDVIYHEYSHCLIYQIYNGMFISQSIENYPIDINEAEAIDEGLADFITCSLNNNSIFGNYILDEPRDLDNNEIFNENSNEYDNGTVIGGALWNLWKNEVVGN